MDNAVSNVGISKLKMKWVAGWWVNMLKTIYIYYIINIKENLNKLLYSE